MESLKANYDGCSIASSFTDDSENSDNDINQIYVSRNINVTLDINDEILIVLNTAADAHRDIVSGGINDLQDYLKSMIDKLYDTIDVLKQEARDKKEIINKQNRKLEYFKEELLEENLLIRALTMRDANIGSFAFHNSTENNDHDVTVSTDDDNGIIDFNEHDKRRIYEWQWV